MKNPRIGTSGWGNDYAQYAVFSPNQIKSVTNYVGTFDKTNDDINYSFRRSRQQAEIKAIDVRFNEELEQQARGDIDSCYQYNLGRAGNILAACGVPNQPILLSAGTINEKTTASWHRFNYTELKNLPLAFQKPIAVFSYGDGNKAQNVIVNLSHNWTRILAGIHFNQDGNGTVVNQIRGLFPKYTAKWLNWIQKGE